MSPSLGDLHPAQNRGFRELFAALRHLVSHYRGLAQRVDDPALGHAEQTARRLLDELRDQTRRYDLHGGPAAQGVGINAARGRSGVTDRFLERNQALRLAVLDVQHVVTLLAYLGRVSETNGNADLAEFCERWRASMAEVEERVRSAAVDTGGDPAGAVEPVDPSAVGRAAHGVAYWVGTFGERFDRRAARRRS